MDDKIINRANKEGRDWQEVAQTYIDAFHEDMDRLGVLRADLEPRATEYIPQIQELCAKLIAEGTAYATPSGDVYFRVRSYPPYGKLSGRSLDELLSGARVAPGRRKGRSAGFRPLEGRQARRALLGQPLGQGPSGCILNARP